MRQKVNNKNNGRAFLALRVPQALMQTLRDLAKTNRRPFSWQVIIVIEEGLKQLGVSVDSQ